MIDDIRYIFEELERLTLLLSSPDSQLENQSLIDKLQETHARLKKICEVLTADFTPTSN